MVERTKTLSGYRESNSTADRTLTILGLFADEHLTVSATEVATALGVARSTAYRYLQSLVTTNFLEEAPGGGFRLGLQILVLARLARKGYGLSTAILPLMKELAQRFHETVLLTRRIGSSIVCVEREEWSGQYIRLSYERGTTLDLNAGASALVLLAWLPEQEVRALLSGRELRKFNENTLTEVEPIIERLRKIRSDGYAVSYGEVDTDVLGIAAPIFDESGTAVAALSIVAMHRRLPMSARSEQARALTAAAADASHTLAIISS